jgi:hypothetical protein
MVKNHRLYILPILFLSSVLFGAGSLGAQIVSGDYEELLIGADPKTGTVTGYYENFTGFDQSTGAPRFSCIFFLRGSMQGAPPFEIETWFPADKTRENLIQGTLNPAQTDGSASMKIKLEKEHGGCPNVQKFAEKGGAEFRLDNPGKWFAIRVVSAAKSHFHDEASDAKKRKAYVIKGNPVRVYDMKPGWVFAEYRAEGKTTSGWIREADLFPAESPSR